MASVLPLSHITHHVGAHPPHAHTRCSPHTRRVSRMCTNSSAIGMNHAHLQCKLHTATKITLAPSSLLHQSLLHQAHSCAPYGHSPTGRVNCTFYLVAANLAVLVIAGIACAFIFGLPASTSGCVCLSTHSLTTQLTSPPIAIVPSYPAGTAHIASRLWCPCHAARDSHTRHSEMHNHICALH